MQHQQNQYENVQVLDSSDANMHTVPADWCSLCGICAFTCCYCDFPLCWGSKNAYHCICLRGEDIACKTYEFEDKNACCIYETALLEVTSCSSTCKGYSQYFCIEVVFNCAGFSAEPRFYKNPTTRISTDTTDPNLSKTIVCCASFCSISSCNYDCPGNCQCYEKSENCWCQNDKVQMKPVCFDAAYGKDDVCCLVAKRNSILGCYPTCFKNITQCYCCDQRSAIPCSKEVPYGYSCFPFCMFCPKVGCCLSVASLYGDVGDHQVMPVAQVYKS